MVIQLLWTLHTGSIFLTGFSHHSAIYTKQSLSFSMVIMQKCWNKSSIFKRTSLVRNVTVNNFSRPIDLIGLEIKRWLKNRLAIARVSKALLSKLSILCINSNFYCVIYLSAWLWGVVAIGHSSLAFPRENKYIKFNCTYTNKKSKSSALSLDSLQSLQNYSLAFKTSSHTQNLKNQILQ